MIQPLSNAADEAGHLYIRTFGCQMNQYDSLRVLRILYAKGYRPTSNIARADVVFLNTCSVREKAEQKVYSFLGRLRSLKAQRPWMKIVVAGCVAQQTGQALLNRFEHLDLVLGTRGIPSIASLLEQVRNSARRLVFLPDEEIGNPAPSEAEQGFESEVAAQVTIMQGCNNFCTYCIVPHVRGRERSRPANEVLQEIDFLLSHGAREILLLGQNVNSYGRGLKETVDFASLLRRIHDETTAARLRFTTSHPKDLTEDLIRCFSDLPILCKHLHLPFQSGSNEILRRMNRGYTSRQYLDRIRRLRELCPDIAISADVMVGFPGESEEDFQETIRLMEEVRFDALFSFSYSDRPFTRAAEFPAKASAQVKARRLAELQGLQAEITLQKNTNEIGQSREVLVEGSSKTANGQLMGRTEHNRIVNFEGDSSLIGRIVRTKITAAYSHSLRGELLIDP